MDSCGTEAGRTSFNLNFFCLKTQHSLWWWSFVVLHYLSKHICHFCWSNLELSSNFVPLSYLHQNMELFMSWRYF